MQGKEKNITRIDKQFRDRSWAEMHKLLDEEMPQIPVKEKGKKRYFLLLIILLIGFISGVGTMLYVNQQRSIEFPERIEAKKELAETSGGFENNVVSDQDQPISSALNNPGKSQNEIINDKAGNLKNAAKYIDKHNEQKEIENSFTTISSGNNSDQNVHSLKTKQSGLIDQSENQSFLESLNAETKQTWLTDLISPKSALLEIPQRFEKIDLLEIRPEKKFYFGITLGAYSNNIKRFAGISFGGKATYNLDRRFSLGAGLQYSILSGYKEGGSAKADEFASFSADLDSTSIAMLDETFGPYRTIQSPSGKTNLPISSLHYIEIPVEFAYHFSKKFQIHMGVKAGYLFKANADGFLNSNNANLSNLSSLNDKDLYNSLNKFDFAGTLGFGFYPIKNFGIDLQYNHGLVDFTRDDLWLQRQINTNKNIQLSAIYFFGVK